MYHVLGADVTQMLRAKAHDQKDPWTLGSYTVSFLQSPPIFRYWGNPQSLYGMVTNFSFLWTVKKEHHTLEHLTI